VIVRERDRYNPSHRRSECNMGAAAALKRRKVAKQGARKRVRSQGSVAPTKVAGAQSSVASRLAPMTPARVRAAKLKFEQGVIARGEASPPGAPLEPGVTHEIVGRGSDAKPILKRRRFSVA